MCLENEPSRIAISLVKLRVTYFLNAAKDSLSRVERQLLPGIHGSPLPQFPRPLPAFSSQSFLFDYVPILREWLQYELYPPADLVERRKRLLAQIALEFRRCVFAVYLAMVCSSDFDCNTTLSFSQLLEVDDAAQVAVLFVEALGGPSASHHVGSSQLGPASSTAICRIDVANANRDVPPVVTLISPYASVRGKANVPLSREITAMLRWDWKLPVEEDVAAFRLVSAGDLFPFSV